MMLAKGKSALTLLSFASKIVARAGTFIIIAPLIGPTNQGIIVATSTWSGIALLLMAFGFSVRVLREIVVHEDTAYSVFAADMKAMAVAFVPSAAILFAIARWFLPPYASDVFAMMFVACAATVIIDYCSSAMRGLDRYALETALSAASSVTQMAGVVTAALVFNSVWAITASLLLSRCTFAVVSTVAVLRIETVAKSRARANPLGKTFASAFPYFVDGSLAVVLQSVDILLLSKLVDTTTVGFYSAGSRIVQLFLVIPWIATNIMVPDLARHEGTKESGAKTMRFLTIMGVLALAGAVGLIVAGPFIQRFVLGPKFVEANQFWPSLAVLILARFYEGGLGVILTSLGKVSLRVALQACAAIFIVLGALVTVPRMGPNGLVLTISAAYALMGLLYVKGLTSIPASSVRAIVTIGFSILVVVLLVGLFLSDYRPI